MRDSEGTRWRRQDFAITATSSFNSLCKTVLSGTEHIAACCDKSPTVANPRLIASMRPAACLICVRLKARRDSARISASKFMLPAGADDAPAPIDCLDECRPRITDSRQQETRGHCLLAPTENASAVALNSRHYRTELYSRRRAAHSRAPARRRRPSSRARAAPHIICIMYSSTLTQMEH